MIAALVERASDGTYSVCMEDVMQLPYGLNGVGATVQEAIADWYGCYEEMRALFAGRGEAFEEVAFTFAYDVPSFLLHYAGKLTYAGLAKLTGVSAAQLSQYAHGYRRPSPKTARRIQRSLHAFGRELSQLRFV